MADEPEEIAVVADFYKRLVSLLSARFAFCGFVHELIDPDLLEPHSRVWPLTYYGPDLVRELGSDRVASAPAWKVESDSRGGTWLWMSELPFTASKEMEDRRTAVEKHLALAERFPND